MKYIGNMDKILIWFDLLSNITINKKEEKTVSIHTIGYEWISFTVILVIFGCMADSIKLSAVCIFKLKKNPKKKNFQMVFIYA